MVSDDPEIQTILKSLGRIAGHPPEPPPPIAPPAQAATEPPAAPEPKPESEPTPKVVRSPIEDRVEAAVKKALGDRTDEPPTTPPEAKPAPATPVKGADDDFIASLPPSQKRTIDAAEFAEKKMGKTGLRQQWVDYWKQVDSYIKRESEKDPDRKFDRTDEAFQAFRERAKPDIDPDEWEEIKYKMHAHQAAQEVEQRVKESSDRDLTEVRNRQRAIEVRPHIERRTREVAGHFESMVAAAADGPLAEVKALLAEHKGNWDAVEEADPFVAPIVRQELDRATQMAAEYVSIRSGVIQADGNNPMHTDLAGFIRQQAEIFEERGGDRRIRQGPNGERLTFVTPAKMAEIAKKNPQGTAGHWTFGEAEVLSLITFNAAKRAEMSAKNIAEKLTKSGYARHKAPVPAEPAKEPQPTASPKATTTPGPGAGTTTPVVANPAFSKDELAALVPGYNWG